MPTAKTHDVDLSPAWTYLLMMGEFAPGRIHGWMQLAQVPLGKLDQQVKEVWSVHGEALTREAARWRFTPAGVSSRHPRPIGNARAWAKHWVAQHSY